MLTWLRRNTKTIMIVVAVLFFGSMFYGLGYQGMKGDGGKKSKSEGIAKVNGLEIDPVRYQEMLNRVAQSFKGNVSPSDMAFIENMALNQSIEFTLMLGEARRRVKVSGAEVDGAIDGIMKQQKIPSKREMERSLKKMGISYNRFKDLIKDDIMVQKLSMKLREEIRITPDDLKEIRVSHILVTQEAAAKIVLEKVSRGDFASLAKQYSKDLGTAGKGGDLGYFTTGMMVEPFEKAAFALQPGQISGIVKTNYGYHIIKVTDSRLRKIPGDEKTAEQTILREKQENVFRRWYSEIRSKIKIEIENPVLRGHDYRFKGLLPQAVAEYKIGETENPNNPYIPIYLGDTYMSAGRKDLALPEYEKAIRVEGANPALYIILGRAYESAGEKELATAQYRKASLIAGDNKDLHEQLLKIFQGMGRKTEAANEKKELQRIEKKEQFEKELTGGR